MLNFTECNNDYDNDETIILASAITLDDELHKQKKKIISKNNELLI